MGEVLFVILARGCRAKDPGLSADPHFLSFPRVAAARGIPDR
jgi:hypothetical protein